MDIPCILTATLFFLSNLLNVCLRSKELSQTSNFNTSLFESLDPKYIQEQWAHQSENRGLRTTAGLLNALAWFSLCIPLLQVAWILSRAGRRKLGIHVLISVLVVGGSVTELVSRLMTVGMVNTSEWIARSFNLDDWVAGGSGDGIGWRTLQLISLVTRGMLLWIDAFEWFALFGVLTLIFVSVQSEKQDDSSFGEKWAYLGLCIAVLSAFDFLADVLRLVQWRTFMTTALVISVVNTLILLPSWLVILARQLPDAKAPYNSDDVTAHTKLPVNSIATDDIV